MSSPSFVFAEALSAAVAVADDNDSVFLDAEAPDVKLFNADGETFFKVKDDLPDEAVRPSSPLKEQDETYRDKRIVIIARIMTIHALIFNNTVLLPYFSISALLFPVEKQNINIGGRNK